MCYKQLQPLQSILRRGLLQLTTSDQTSRYQTSVPIACPAFFFLHSSDHPKDRMQSRPMPLPLLSPAQAKVVTARNVVTGVKQQHPYDALVLAPGAAAIQPPLPGVGLPGIFQMKTVPDR